MHNERAVVGPVITWRREAVSGQMKSWLRYNWQYNRRWMVVSIALSLAGALFALLLAYVGLTFYRTVPVFYEPKDEERRQHLERLERAREPGDQPDRTR